MDDEEDKCEDLSPMKLEKPMNNSIESLLDTIELKPLNRSQKSKQLIRGQLYAFLSISFWNTKTSFMWKYTSGGCEFWSGVVKQFSM